MPEALVAHTRRVDSDVDLVAMASATDLLMARGNVGLLGRGVATRIAVEDAAAAQAQLAAIAVSGDEVGLPGCGPVALAAWPFDPNRPRELVVPAEVWGRAADGTRWHTRIGPGGAAPGVDAAATDNDHDEPTGFEVESAIDPKVWCEAVATGRDACRDEQLQKLVLAREVTVTANAPLSVPAILQRLRAAYPDAFLFSVEGLVGATPELLVSRSGDLVHAHPMAGTVPRTGDPTADARLAATLLASAKDRWEHQITIDMVHETLLPWCSYLDYEAEPSVVSMANVAHLATMVEGRLSQPAPSVLELVHALHPTPAVGGAPRADALALIAKLEQLDRGRYGGPVGWVDARGNGLFAVGIRCAEIHGATARLFAGVGVVADSDPTAELAETRAKLQALLSAIVRP